MQIVIDIAIFLVSAIIFTFVGMAIRKKVAESKLGSAEEEARKIINLAQKEAENKKKEEIFIMGLTPVYVGTYVTAESASNIIDAEGIISGANSVKSQLSELDYLSSAVTSAGSRITANDLSVDGVGLEEKVGQVTSLINETKSNFE